MSRYQLSMIDQQIKDLQEKREQIVREMEAKKTSFDRYMDTYHGQELLKKHNLTEYGIWKVYGEDPNCDFGGSHYEPEIGLYEGTLEKVLRKVTEMSKFWTWGGGGRVVKTEIEKAERL
jgi:hypothetical protein